MDKRVDSAQPRIQALLERYIAERLRGNAPAAEELCQGSPDLLPALESCIREYEELRGGLAPSARSPASEAPTEDLPEGLLVPGLILGDRYQIRSRLGRGGMGEVWRAFDLKLRVEVALKALLPDRFRDERRRELLRREVRAAREVVSPNVCRIFDLIEVDGVELVSMEYVDGETLLEHLSEQSPLDLKQAQEIASQFLAGLEAIHQAGLVHRDVKPENIMLTRSGRVVLMDFGLARGTESGAGTVSGTPAYMAPEQAAGLQVDGRADLYSAGVVLAEMVMPGGIGDLESRQSVWEGIRQEPVELPDSAWSRVLEQAVAKARDQRYESAHALNRALEDATLRVEGAEDLKPYPGLAAFTEADAEYFFGREAEVEALWAKLEGPARLLGLVGPSGAGKTSFLRAGVTPNASPEWAILRCTPGSSPRASLRRTLVPALGGDTEALTELASGEDEASISAFSRWRGTRTRALLVVDQFEELFTLNSEETQAAFAELVGRLPLESDVHVVLAMRDDFLMECNRHRALRSMIPDLTLLDPPMGTDLRRALVNPATKCGYRFEDEEIVEEMLAEVEGERGALPLLAFSMARLWEKRDRKQGLVTRPAYEEIGGVAGALARHAEATLERIGTERIPIVRELFRNLVTAERTRAVCAWDELLSVFEESSRDTAGEVLRQLIDARLLTSYEVHDEDEEPTRRVEIIHESLLAHWPRLVGWQTQDADSARLRDELRQAARTWHEHGRSDDRLWTGSAYREFEVWRERYPGGLSEVEEAFASAMTSLATRRRRRRRMAVTVGFAILLLGLAVVASFWQRSVRETLRAEAANVASLGQLELESYPSATVAHAIASLELADNQAARRLALEALWKGPTALVASEDFAWAARFSPDGQFLVQAEYLSAETEKGHLTLFHADGTRDVLKNVYRGSPTVVIEAITESGYFVTYDVLAGSGVGKIAIWSIADQQPVAETTSEALGTVWQVAVNAGQERALILSEENDRLRVSALGFDGGYERIGTLDFALRDEQGQQVAGACLAPIGEWIGVASKTTVHRVDIGDRDISRPHYLGTSADLKTRVSCDPMGRYLATVDEKRTIELWSLDRAAPPVVLAAPPEATAPNPVLRFTDDGSILEAGVREKGDWIVWLWDVSRDQPRFLRRMNLGPSRGVLWQWDPAARKVAMPTTPTETRIWSLDAPADAEPVVVLEQADRQQANGVAFEREGRWLATTDANGLTLWPLTREYPIVIREQGGQVIGLAFDPKGRWLVSSTVVGRVMLWPLEGHPPAPGRELGFGNAFLAVSPDGGRILAGSQGGAGVPNLFSPEGRVPRTLPRSTFEIFSVAFSPDDRLAAGIGGLFNPAERVIEVWDLASGEVLKVLDVGESPIPFDLQFISTDELLAMGESGLYRWNVRTEERELLYAGKTVRFAADVGGRRVFLVERGDAFSLFGHLVLLDLDSGAAERLARFGDDVSCVSVDRKGEFVVTGDRDGEVRMGRVAGGEPHLFLGNDTNVWIVAVDPRGRWIASGSDDFTIRLWPMPDLSKPPLHTLPREELIAKLKTLTNLRVVRDEAAATGWTLTHDPFPGWETVPTW